MTEFGVALGGGGVKGLAHISLLKRFDELGVKPSKIAGTSMGAILAALYAEGLSGAEIEERVRDHIFSRKDGLKKAYEKRAHLVKWVKVFAFEKSRGGIFTADGLFQHLFTEIVDLDFSDLKIPLTTVATDFHSGEEIAISTGNLLTAVRASMAVPGIFAPVSIGDRLLIDGGLINNVPCNHVTGENRVVIASDVISLSTQAEPKYSEVMSGALSIMLRAVTQQNFSQYPPDFLFQPDTEQIDAFDFHKIAQVLERGDQAIEEQSPALDNLLSKL